MHDVPENLLYSKDHEWIEIDGDIGTIGISDHAQAELSDVVFVDLPEVGATVAAGDPVAVVESVKAASDVYTPVSGEILEVNEELSNDPSLINSDPYGAGWLYKIRLDVPTETEDMMNATDYEEKRISMIRSIAFHPKAMNDINNNGRSSDLFPL